MVNKVILVGRLGQDPESREIGDSEVCNFSMATDRGVKDKTDWHRVSVWGKQAAACQQYLGKGSLVCVEGAVEYDQREDRTFTNIRAHRVTFLSPKSESSEEKPKSSKPPF